MNPLMTRSLLVAFLHFRFEFQTKRLENNLVVDEENLPPTYKGRQYELRALGLREFAGLRRDDEPLDPFDLAYYARIMVLDVNKVDGLSDETKQHLLNEGSNNWSGGTASKNLPNGWRLVILNPTHGAQRMNATLMEEICHVFLGHKPNRLAVINQDKDGQTRARDYVHDDEEAAYSIGAAALVPYSSLKRFVQGGKSAREIAKHFNVSQALIIYRIKVSRLWDEYKQRNPKEIEERARQMTTFKSQNQKSS